MRARKTLNTDALYEALVNEYGSEIVDTGADELAEYLEIAVGSLAKAANALRDAFDGTTSAAWVANSLADGVGGETSAQMRALKAFAKNRAFGDMVENARLALTLVDEIYEKQSDTAMASIGLKRSAYGPTNGWFDNVLEEQKFWDAAYAASIALTRPYDSEAFFAILEAEGIVDARDLGEELGRSGFDRILDDLQKKIERNYFKGREEAVYARAHRYQK